MSFNTNVVMLGTTWQGILDAVREKADTQKTLVAGEVEALIRAIQQYGGFVKQDLDGFIIFDKSGAQAGAYKIDGDILVSKASEYSYMMPGLDITADSYTNDMLIEANQKAVLCPQGQVFPADGGWTSTYTGQQMDEFIGAGWNRSLFDGTSTEYFYAGADDSSTLVGTSSYAKRIRNYSIVKEDCIANVRLINNTTSAYNKDWTIYAGSYFDSTQFDESGVGNNHVYYAQAITLDNNINPGEDITLEIPVKKGHGLELTTKNGFVLTPIVSGLVEGIPDEIASKPNISMHQWTADNGSKSIYSDDGQTTLANTTAIGYSIVSTEVFEKDTEVYFYIPSTNTNIYLPWIGATNSTIGKKVYYAERPQRHTGRVRMGLLQYYYTVPAGYQLAIGHNGNGIYMDDIIVKKMS